jgi:hypothetical protein
MPNELLSWTATRHIRIGNPGYVDGSVAEVGDSELH